MRHWNPRRNYRGWYVYYQPGAPVTGRWAAVRYGVSICAGTEEAIIHMIDTRPDDQRVGSLL